jgi:hypothetical protein
MRRWSKFESKKRKSLLKASGEILKTVYFLVISGWPVIFSLVRLLSHLVVNFRLLPKKNHVVLGILVLKNLFVFSLFLLAFALRLDDICSVILDNETRLQCRDVWGKKAWQIVVLMNYSITEIST